jgi:hypothetical protein
VYVLEHIQNGVAIVLADGTRIVELRGGNAFEIATFCYNLPESLRAVYLQGLVDAFRYSAMVKRILPMR